jgi:hypothetical protein
MRRRAWFATRFWGVSCMTFAAQRQPSEMGRNPAVLQLPLEFASSYCFLRHLGSRYHVHVFVG